MSSCYPPHENWLSFSEARDALIAAIPPLTTTETVDLLAGLGRVLAVDVLAPINVPAFANSAMDGYALCYQDVVGVGASLAVSQRIAAGSSPTPLQRGTVARIFTGAPLPSGADTVIMQEDVTLADDVITLNAPLTHGAYVRDIGADITRGALLFAKGTRLSAANVGLLASVGITHLQVVRRARVALLTTGDELVMPGTTLTAGKIYNSNHFLLLSLLRNLGCEIVGASTAPDQLDRTIETLRDVAARADLVITCGGVSVGEEDHVKHAIEAIGKLAFWRVAIKPGKPLAFGRIGTTHVLGLPGNPVSACVTFCLFARPLLLRLQGALHVLPRSFRVRAAFSWPKPGARREFLRAQCHRDAAEDDCVTIFPNQNSGVLSSVSWAHGLVCVPEQQTVSQGDIVEFFPYSELGL